jgi:mono/diheme cytochrome c family protein
MIHPSVCRRLVFLAILPFGLPLGAQEQGLPNGVTEAEVAEGKTIFTAGGLCFACHGPDGRGMTAVGPDLTDQKWIHISPEFSELVELITAGVEASRSTNGVLMPPKGGAPLTPQQVKAVAAYVWTLSRKDGPGTPN